MLRRARGALAHRLEQAQERRFDARRGISTAGVVDLSRGAATPYQPVHPAAFAEMLAHVPGDRSAQTFVDYGSGRGRALFLAAEAGFRSVVGVEVEESHHAVAVENLARYRGRREVPDRVTLVLGDARELALPPGPVVAFLYNPFGADLVAELRDRMIAALRSEPRPAWLVYEAPRHRQRFDGHPAFTLLAERMDTLGASARRPRFAVYAIDPGENDERPA